MLERIRSIKVKIEIKNKAKIISTDFLISKEKEMWGIK